MYTAWSVLLVSTLHLHLLQSWFTRLAFSVRVRNDHSKLFSALTITVVKYYIKRTVMLQVEEQAGDVASKTPDTRQRLLQLAKEHIARHFTAESPSV